MSAAAETPPEALLRRPSRWRAILDSDLVYSFLRSRVTVSAAVVTLVIVLAAMLAAAPAPPALAVKSVAHARPIGRLTLGSA